MAMGAPQAHAKLGSNSKNERRSTASHEDAELQKFRRVVVRYERHAENFLGMPHLASALILLRHL